MMWLAEKATSLENENEGMKRVIREMEVKIGSQESTMNEMVERHPREEAAIAYIAEQIQRQEVFNKSAMTSINGLVDEVKSHQEGFRGIATIIQIHKQHVTVNGTVSEQMAQYVNALIADNEKKTAWIGNLMRESKAKTEVLRQHEKGQQVLAGVIKWMANQQQPPQPQQDVTGKGLVATEIDEEDRAVQDFRSGPVPQTGPPDIGSMSMEIVPLQVPNQVDVIGRL